MNLEIMEGRMLDNVRMTILISVIFVVILIFFLQIGCTLKEQPDSVQRYKEEHNIKNKDSVPSIAPPVIDRNFGYHHLKGKESYLVFSISDKTRYDKTYLVKNYGDGNCLIKSLSGLHVKAQNSFIEYDKIKSKYQYICDEQDYDEIQNTLSFIDQNSMYLNEYVPIQNNQTIQISLEPEDLIGKYSFIDEDIRITYLKDNICSVVTRHTIFDYIALPRLAFGYNAYTDLVDYTVAEKICLFDNEGYKDKEGESCFFRKMILANTLDNVPENFYFIGEGDKDDYQFFEQYIDNEIDGDNYTEMPMMPRYYIFPRTQERPEYTNIFITHEKGTWVCYASLFIHRYAGEAGHFQYPSMYKLSEATTEEVIGKIEVPIKDFDTIASEYMDVNDYFARGKNEMMGIISNNNLQLYSSPFEKEPIQIIQSGDDPRIVMLEWLTEEEYKDWEEYFKTKEEVQ